MKKYITLSISVFVLLISTLSFSEEFIQRAQYDEFKKLVFNKQIIETVAFLEAESIGAYEINKSSFGFLSFAATECSLKLVKYLVNSGVRLESSMSFNPLFASLEAGCETVSTYLINRGANIQYTTKDGLNLLYATASGSTLEMFKTIESLGVEIITLQQSKDSIGGALKRNERYRDDICSYLLNRGF